MVRNRARIRNKVVRHIRQNERLSQSCGGNPSANHDTEFQMAAAPLNDEYFDEEKDAAGHVDDGFCCTIPEHQTKSAMKRMAHFGVVHHHENLDLSGACELMRDNIEQWRFSTPLSRNTCYFCSKHVNDATLF